MPPRRSSRGAPAAANEETSPSAAASSPKTKGRKSTGKRKTDEKEVEAETTEAGPSTEPPTTATPTKKAASRKASKSKKDDDAADNEEAGPSTAKKPRRKATAASQSDSPAAPTGEDILAFEGCPLNTEIPNPLTLADSPRPSTSIRIASWNIVSLKSAEPKGLVRYIEAEDADILVLSETKVNEVPSFFQSQRYPHQTWGIGATKSYAGIAILSKIQPLSVQKGLPLLEDYDSKGRCLILEYSGCYVVGTYCVNAGEGLKSMNQKQAWNKALSTKLTELDAIKPVIWTGDLNVVLDERDLSKAKGKWNKSPGYTEIECDYHRKFLEATLEDQAEGAKPFKDIWREKHSDATGHFTFYGWRGQCRSKGIGWRLDSFIISERLKDQCTKCEIRHEIYGASDHVPIYADFNQTLFQ